MQRAATAGQRPRPACGDLGLKIVLYVSDHGYGHATRSIALARSLIEEGRGRARVELVCGHAARLAARALAGAPQAAVRERPTDVGFLCREDRLAFDVGRTALAVNNWIRGWKGFVAEEAARLAASRPDLVITDVAPEACLVAERLGVPSVVASNFNWVDQYERHLRADLVAPLRGAYSLASRGHVYPLRTPLAGVRNQTAAGLVSRQPRRTRAQVRGEAGVGEGEVLVHLGFGWSSDAAALGADLDVGWLPARVRLLVSSNLAGRLERRGPEATPRVLAIPPDELEAQDWIAACDLVVAKAGYSTVAEAILGRVPVLAVPVEGSVESEGIARAVVRLGVGLACPMDSPEGERIFAEASAMLDDLERYRAAFERLPADFQPGAAARLARELLDHPPSLD